MAIKIDSYYYGDQGTRCTTENISHVIDQMIRVTAKITEHFASDIVYDINALQRAVKEHRPYDCILFFRECGVNSFDIECVMESKIDAFALEMNSAIQVWRLYYCPSAMETKFIRVHLREG